MVELGAPAVPILLTGMVGSRQGWIETPYVACPAGVADIAKGLVEAPWAGSHCAIAPGVVTHAGWPDVMRGEETQVLGTLAVTGATAGRFVLPGTHSKWLDVVDGRITGFRSFMTGEVFAALKGHTILGRLMDAAAPPGSLDRDAFHWGVTVGAAPGAPGDLLHRIFSTRTRALFGDLSSHAAADYLSGMVIGAEVMAARPPASEVVTIVGSDALVVRYQLAMRALDVAAQPAPADAAAIGARAIAAAAGWF
jgi:2-dehydro-3-deoxygalactonokinase